MRYCIQNLTQGVPLQGPDQIINLHIIKILCHSEVVKRHPPDARLGQNDQQDWKEKVRQNYFRMENP